VLTETCNVRKDSKLSESGKGLHKISPSTTKSEVNACFRESVKWGRERETYLQENRSAESRENTSKC